MAKRRADSPLRNLRRMRTISQDDLARLAGITQESLSKAERGILRLSPDVQALIATILGVSREEAFPQTEVTA